MPQDLFHYDKMVERALRGVIRDVLARVAQEGPKSAHHFYIGFATQAPGVVMDNVEKKTDVSVELAIKGIMAGSQPPIAALGLKEGGMSLTALDPDVKDSKCTIADYPDVIAKVKGAAG